MRFKKGTKVEVMNKKELPISWRSAEIIGGNGHTYSVMYDYYPGKVDGAMMERVSRKLVRPCRHISQGVETWEVGDTVEVFQDHSWKIATISKAMPGDRYIVRLLGCFKECNIHKLNIREQQLWLGDKWILIGKSSGACGTNLIDKPSNSNLHQKTSFQVAKSNARAQIEAQKNCLDFHENTMLQETNKVSSRSLKRLPPDSSSFIESLVGKAQKIRRVKKDGREQMVAPPPSVKKANHGEIYVRASIDNRMSEHNEWKREKLDGVVGSSLAESAESSDSDSDASSVGSCSVMNETERRFPIHLAQVPCQLKDNVCGNAELFSSSKDDVESCSLSHPPEEVVATSIHNLELHAYRCTLEALHARGPLSWDQETLLTNLRIMLHISNDEHLMELRYLLSGKIGARHR